jgi:hypothetical protein
MNRADIDRIHELCALIAVEPDRQKFLTLVAELNSILSVQGQNLQNSHPVAQEQKKD